MVITPDCESEDAGSIPASLPVTPEEVEVFSENVIHAGTSVLDAAKAAKPFSDEVILKMMKDR